jgi:hypothetical protein
VEDSSNGSFEVGVMNRPPPTPRAVGHSENRKAPLRSKVLALLSLSLSKIQILIHVLERRFEFPLSEPPIQARAHLPLPRRPRVFVTLVDSIPGSFQGLWLSPRKFVLSSSSWGLIVSTGLALVATWKD